jgi:hypothetical protein
MLIAYAEELQISRLVNALRYMEASITLNNRKKISEDIKYSIFRKWRYYAVADQFERTYLYLLERQI